jgi:hypothetical protein
LTKTGIAGLLREVQNEAVKVKRLQVAPTSSNLPT